MAQQSELASSFSTSTSTAIPSRQVLEETPARALRFLGAVARVFGIRAQLAPRGYDEVEHRRAWDLLHQVSHFRPEASSSFQHDAAVREAIGILDGWDERGFRIASAALKHRHPEQHAFVFDDLAAAQGEAAVVSVSRFLDRLDALESSPDRAGTRDADLAALETLARRGVHAAERARLRQLVDVAQAVLPPPEENSDRLENLAALHAWLDEWSETARAVIRRRDHLIALGLVKRRKKKAAEADEQPGEGAPPAPGTEGPAASTRTSGRVAAPAPI